VVRHLACLSLTMGAVGALLAGCGSGSSGASSTTSASAPTSPEPASTSGSAGISTARLPGLGQALVGRQGRALYIFMPDAHNKVTCVSTCAQIWPPLKLTAGRMPTTSAPVRSSLLGSDPDPEGGRVVTYAGWPLYTYIEDSVPHTAAGQALNANGGLWYVIAPSGEVVTKTP